MNKNDKEWDKQLELMAKVYEEQRLQKEKEEIQELKLQIDKLLKTMNKETATIELDRFLKMQQDIRGLRDILKEIYNKTKEEWVRDLINQYDYTIKGYC